MKMKLFVTLVVAALAVTGGIAWFTSSPPPPAAAANGRKVLYYQSAMHPWIKSDKPGKCPICGMNLVPVYEGESGPGATNGLVALGSNSISVLNVQTVTVQRRPLTRTLHVAGVIEMDVHPTHFVFTAYERDFAWLDVGQEIDVTIPSSPGKTYEARITRVDSRFQDSGRADLSHGLQVRATLSESLVQVDGVKRWRPFDGFYAEGRVIVNTPPVLTAPRNTVLWDGAQSIVYVDNGNGRYQKRVVQCGRVGDDTVEILGGLKDGERVVARGNLMIDAEAQLAASQ